PYIQGRRQYEEVPPREAKVFSSFEPHSDALSVRVQVFCQGKGLNVSAMLLQSGLRIANKASSFEKVVDAKGGGKTGGTRSRQDMVRTSEIVTHWFTGIGTKKDGPS